MDDTTNLTATTLQAPPLNSEQGAPLHHGANPATVRARIERRRDDLTDLDFKIGKLGPSPGAPDMATEWIERLLTGLLPAVGVAITPWLAGRPDRITPGVAAGIVAGMYAVAAGEWARHKALGLVPLAPARLPELIPEPVSPLVAACVAQLAGSMVTALGTAGDLAGTMPWAVLAHTVLLPALWGGLVLAVTTARSTHRWADLHRRLIALARHVHDRGALQERRNALQTQQDADDAELAALHGHGLTLDGWLIAHPLELAPAGTASGIRRASELRPEDVH